MKKLILVVAMMVMAGQAWGASIEGVYRSKNPDSDLTISKGKDGKHKFYFLGMYNGGNGMVNTGELEFEATATAGKVQYVNGADDPECKIEITFSNPKTIKVNQIEGSCGAGMNVYYGGTYKKTKKK